MGEMSERITEKIKELEVAVQIFEDATAKLKEASAEMWTAASNVSSKVVVLAADIEAYHTKRSSELMALAERIAKEECA